MSALLRTGTSGQATLGAALATLPPWRLEGRPVSGWPVHVPTRARLVESSWRLAASPLHPRGSCHAGQRPRLDRGRFRPFEPAWCGPLLEERARAPLGPLDFSRRDITGRTVRAPVI